MSKLLCVIGMHRSGTSAVAGTLSRLGVDFGSQLMPSSPDNPKGYYEAMPVVRAHDRLLRVNGRSWCHQPVLLPVNFITQEATFAVKKLDTWYASIEDSRLPGVKDPRMCVMLPLWQRFADYSYVELVPLIVRRDPDAIARSLVYRECWDKTRAHRLMDNYYDGISEWANLPDAVELNFADLLSDPEGALADTDIELPDCSDSSWEEVDDFLDLELVHHGA